MVHQFGLLVKRLRRRPLTPETPVRFWYGSPIAGVYGAEVTPVPIPNTEVKLCCEDDTWSATTREIISMPALYSSLAQSVEHSAVNRVVARSSRAGGAKKRVSNEMFDTLFAYYVKFRLNFSGFLEMLKRRN